MKFVWKILPPRDDKAPHGQEALAAALEKGKPQEFKEQEKNLKAYLEAREKQNLNQKERADFRKKLEQWDLSGDVEAIRRAGIAEKDNLQDPLKRHLLLSSEFLEPIESAGKYTFRVDFKANQMAYWKVGAADMLPPNVAAISVKKEDGSIVSERAVRRINPGTGRIGYYDEKFLEEDVYEYVPVFTGDEITILETGTMQPTGSPQSMKEHVEIYQRGAMKDEASESIEKLYDAKTRTVHPDVKTALKAQRTQLESGARGQLAGLRREIVPQQAGRVQIEGKWYERADRNLWMREVGTTEAETRRWITNKDPLTGQKLTFLGCPIPDGMNRLVIPYMKEAERRIRAEGIRYDVHGATCTCFRPIRGLERQYNETRDPRYLSNHSWGVALDVNPGDNPMGTRWENLDPRRRVPQRVVEIMESMGFFWGGRWERRPDAMHFEFKLDPFKAKGLLTDQRSMQYMASAEKLAGDRTQRYAQAHPPESKEQPSGVRAEGWQGVRPEGRVPEESPSTRQVSKVSAESIEASVAKYNDLIYEASEKYGVPANLVKTVIWQESGGRPWLASHAGAGGLMQLMPQTAKGVGIEPIFPLVVETNSRGKKTYRLDERDGRMDPRTNIMAGTKLLAGLLKKYNGDVKTALASYNWGSGNVSKYFRGEKRIPEETAFYYKNITGIKERLDEADPRHA